MRPIRFAVPTDQRIIELRPRSYRLNRSRKLDLKPGKYDGRSIVTAVRHCPAMRPA